MTSTPVMDIGMTQPRTIETGGMLPTSKGDFKENLMAAMNAGGMSEAPKQMINDLAGTAKKDNLRVESTERDANLKDDQSRVKSQVDNQGSKTVDNDGKSKEITSKQKDAINEKTQEVVNKVAEEMDVTPDEVVQAMETLGLTMIDLLNPDNMTDLVAFISGSEDALSILTDESLYQTLGTLQDFVSQITEDLTEELDLSQEALNEVLEQAEELLKQTDMTDEQNSPLGENQTVNKTEELPLEGMKDFKTTTVVDGKEVTIEVEMDESTGVMVSNTSETKLQSEDKDSSENKSGDSGTKENESQTSIFTQTIQQNIEMPEVSQMTEQVNGFDSNTTQIAEQILENMKANLKPEMTELEMNLHPASLGNVRVNLTAQDGQISAQFVAQNETVKAAIEAQITQLTNQFEEQGIKVERVEVAVAEHGFDDNTRNGAGENQNSNNNAGKAKAGRVRRIDLSALDDEEGLEELEESDRIAVEMMAQNGNTVDYTA